jgi:hypothetical protein
MISGGLEQFLLFSVLYFGLLIGLTVSQYRYGEDKYIEAMNVAETELTDQILDAHEELAVHVDPYSVLLPNNDYRFHYPLSEEYRIQMIIDPCRGHTDPISCCVNVYGSPEYPKLIVSGHTQERVVAYSVLGNETEVQLNYELVYEDTSAISTAATRTPDDDELHDTACNGIGDPYSWCYGKNYAYKKSSLRPACMDNNQSLNALDDCYGIDGSVNSRCVQVGYSQNAFVGTCLDDSDPHCGTFIEVHSIQGTPYSTQDDVIADVRIASREVSGFTTTVLPLSWMGSSNKVLCSYTESYIRVGSIVYVLPRMQYTPTCCCPKPFKPSTRVGSVQCPKGPNGGGAFAFKIQNMAQTITVDTNVLAYPYCNIDLTSTYDSMLCSVYDKEDRRHYVRQCDNVTLDSSGSYYVSLDLDGLDYAGVCPYFPSCALTIDDGKCRGEDLVYTFQGRVGRVTAVDDAALIPTVMVTFNDGRTSYLFNKDMVTLETYKSMYELWWVLRTPTEFVVQKRKGFNVTEPACTFDTVNNRYFPYAVLDDDGNPLDSSTLAESAD